MAKFTSTDPSADLKKRAASPTDLEPNESKKLKKTSSQPISRTRKAVRGNKAVASAISASAPPPATTPLTTSWEAQVAAALNEKRKDFDKVRAKEHKMEEHRRTHDCVPLSEEELKKREVGVVKRVRTKQVPESTKLALGMKKEKAEKAGRDRLRGLAALRTALDASIEREKGLLEENEGLRRRIRELEKGRKRSPEC